MAKVAVNWPELAANAAKFGVDMAKFNKLEKFFNTVDPEFFTRCAENTIRNFPMDEVKNLYSGNELAQLLLLCAVANRANLEELYSRKNYPESMLKEISADMPVWLNTLERDLDGYGLTESIFAWAQACLDGIVIPCGRLQCNNTQLFTHNISIYRNGDQLDVRPALTAGNPPHPALSKDDKVINMHIPASGPLKVEDCRKSFRRMQEFFAKFQPDYDYKAFVCTSWLLDEQYQEILPPTSNIVQFQKLGHLIQLPEYNTNGSALWRIWGDAGKNLPLEKLPARSSLEKAVIKFLQSGGTFHSGLLVIFPDEL